jgi:SAM-dependent methyltransferase
MKDFWNQRYSEEGFAYGTEANDFLKNHFHYIKPGGKILCIAEGEGRNALFLAANGYQVTAVDMSEVGIMKAQSEAQRRGLQLNTIVANLEDFDFGESTWDGIVSIFGHLPPAIRKRVHKKLVNGLTPGGLFLFEAYTPKQLALGTGGPKDISLMIDHGIIEDELSDLKAEIFQEINREIKEGKYHDGESSVMQYLGRKQFTN